MKCYYAPNEDAVGVCKACGKGLSPNYITEYPYGLACKGRCESQVEKLIAMVSRSMELQKPTQSLVKKSGRMALGSGVFLLLLGAVFLYQSSLSQWRDIFSLAFGAIFFGYGLLQIVRGISIIRSFRK